MWKRLLTILIINLFAVTVISSQDILKGNRTVSVCYAGKTQRDIYIPPPAKSIWRKGETGATITVYYTGFSGAPKEAFDYAVAILASILPSDANITVRAVWRQLSDVSILGNTSVSSLIRGSSVDALYPSVYYPVALAERISGRPLNDVTEADLTLTINSRISWYTGTDGKPRTQYDLVTVVLHELLHGLGFYDSFNAVNNTGSYGISSIPFVYDIFVESSAGLKLTDKSYFQNSSAELYNELTGGRLYFKGPVTGERIRIYAPAEYDAGSSISHLDEERTIGINQLMTPFLDPGEAIHDPGKLTMSMLGEFGWINTRLTHIKPRDTEENLTEIDLNLSVASDSLFYRDNVGFVFSYDNFRNFDTIYMNPVTGTDSFTVKINISAYNTLVSYYFLAKDIFGRVFRSPSVGTSAPYSVYIGADTIKPDIKHTSIKYLFDKVSVLSINCTASDNSGIDTVYAEYRINGGSSLFMGLKNDSLDNYSIQLNLKSAALKDGDRVEYRIVARDKANNPNTKIFPASSFISVPVYALKDAVTSYETDFTGASGDFILDGFTVLRPSQFTSQALHSKHPYESPEVDDAEIEYTALLKYPVRVDETGIIISFLEIVLVEPGDAGSVFGDPDFFDYVIVEGSTDYGTTWFPLANGYDSRISPAFEEAYNSSVTGNNSTYTGTQSMFEKKTIDIRTFEKFKANDTIMIRFRLYSDPYANGWGWAVEDLSVKSVAAGVDDTHSSANIILYPNPGTGAFQIKVSDENNGRNIPYRILNMSGIEIRAGEIPPATVSTIDISDQPPGIYLILLRNKGSHSTLRYTKIR